MEAGEEMVDPFSQSFSPFWALLRPGDISRDREGECDRLEKKQQTKWVADINRHHHLCT